MDVKNSTAVLAQEQTNVLSLLLVLLSFRVHPSRHHPSAAVFYLLLMWTRRFSCLFSSVSTNLWYGPLERKKDNCLFTLTKPYQVASFAWYVLCRHGWMKVRQTWRGSCFSGDVWLFFTHVQLCTLKTKKKKKPSHPPRGVFDTPDDIQWHFHPLNYAKAGLQ